MPGSVRGMSGQGAWVWDSVERMNGWRGRVAPRVIGLGWPPPDGRRMFYVLGFDPGGTTGWCALRMDAEAVVREGFRAVALGDPEAFQWAVGELSGPEAYVAGCMMALCRGVWADGEFDAGSLSDGFVVGIEDFVLRVLDMDRELLSPVRITASFNQLSWQAPFPVVLPGTADLKKTIDDHRLKLLNMFTVGSDHKRDATRVAVLVARRLSGERQFLAEMNKRMLWL